MSCKECKWYEDGDCHQGGEVWGVCENDSCGHFASKDANDHDPVNHPSHYTQGGIECIDALAAATVNLKGIKAVCTANAIKYLWRWAEKNGVEDIDKAIWYLNRLREEVLKDG